MADNTVHIVTSTISAWVNFYYGMPTARLQQKLLTCSDLPLLNFLDSNIVLRRIGEAATLSYGNLRMPETSFWKKVLSQPLRVVLACCCVVYTMEKGSSGH